MANPTLPSAAGDKAIILHQARSRALDPERFNHYLITALVEHVTLDQLHTACQIALQATSPPRSFHED